jgi:hypothetical protein
MTNILELADRVESGEGADRLLDGEIAKALAPERDWHLFTDTWGARCLDDTASFDMPPHLTASLDAALALVSEGCWAEGSLGRHDSTRSSIEIHAPMTYDPIGRAEASTPARALTAACLRARAEMVK